MVCIILQPYLLEDRIRIISIQDQQQLPNGQNNPHVYLTSFDGNDLVFLSMSQTMILTDVVILFLQLLLYAYYRIMNVLLPATSVFRYVRLLPELCFPSIVLNGCYV